MTGFACLVPHEAMIHLRGTDIPKFLQGQLSCDTRKLSDTQAVMGALCNVQGRVLSDLIVVLISDKHLVLRLRRSVAQSTVETLQRYAQFSRISVELDLRKDAIVGLRETATDLIVPGTAPGRLTSSQRDGVVALQRSGQHGELLSIDPEAPRNLQKSVADYEEDSEARWALETLRGGHYALESADSGAFTPQALNYDLSGLVAFDKGCYTGQEVVARLHYKGQSKRRLQVFEAPASVESLARDAPLYTGEGEAAVGRCLRFERAPGVLPVIAAEVQSQHLNAALLLSSGETLRALPPNYLPRA